jgi:hypothetical protein
VVGWRRRGPPGIRKPWRSLTLAMRELER